MRTAQRILSLAVSFAAMSSFASAYYYWVFFPGSLGPFPPIRAHFDLSALKDNTVQYFISDQGPGALMPGDGTTAIYSQIHQAARVWNGVGSSAVRLHFGGISTVGSPQATPGIDVVFDDNMPPGILAQSRPTVPADLTFVTNTTSFVPILRSRLQLRHDLTAAGYQQASYSDAFFLTLVHEFGHTLGLQHTLTSAVMSTAITRATMKGAPLAPDDIAGISGLYPISGYAAATGSIAGTVTLSGGPVNMASVVALSANGTAISVLTNPDGAYRIDGIPPGQYYVYVHPLPPAQLGEAAPANIVAPTDPANDSFPAFTLFDTQFFPGTKDWTQATQIGVAAGQLSGQVNFAVNRRLRQVIYGMETYGYENGVAVAAPPLQSQTRNSLVFYANGTTIDNQTGMAPGLGVSAIGGTAQIEAGSLRFYTQGFLLMTVDTNQVSASTPVALAVTLNGDLYVLPAAFTVLPSAPPTISAVTGGVTTQGAALATVAGAGLSANTRILFDGVPGNVASVNTDGSLMVSPPAALGGYQAWVAAVNPDGQTSSQALGPATPPTFSYAVGTAASIALASPVVTAGTDTMVTITGVATHFADEQTIAGFGSSDLKVQRAWAIRPGVVMANVSVDPAAQVGATTVTVLTGLELITLPAGIRVGAPGANQSTLRVPVINAVTGLAGVPAGGTALIASAGLPAAVNAWKLTIGGEMAPFSVDKNGQITAQIPGDLTPGPQVVQLIAPDGSGPPPIVLQLDAAPPVIVSAFNNSAAAGAGAAVSPAAPANAGDTVTLTVSRLPDPAFGLPAGTQVWLNFGGAVITPASVTAAPNDATLALVQFVIPAALPTTSPVSLMIGTGTRLSAAYFLDIQPPPPPAPATGGSSTGSSAAH
ncbi:MAG TPA: matrixin family metalloprotease [Bryobacteraceae bacterium]|nr:matrixin family metalloprotease [Bryobacteraceae bacterium]